MPVCDTRKPSLGLALATALTTLLVGAVAFADTPPNATPITTSPETPWYYSAIEPHSGGLFPWFDITPNPYTGTGTLTATNSTNEAAAAAASTPVGTDTNIPFAWLNELGTNDNIYPPYNSKAATAPVVVTTQIPSYVLGNNQVYNNFTDSPYAGSTPDLQVDETINNPPGTNDTTTDSTDNSELLNFAPDANGTALHNNFRDTSTLSWSSPFTWTINNSRAPFSETLDDTGLVSTPPSSTTQPAPPGEGANGINSTNPTWTGPFGLASATTFTLNNGAGTYTWSLVSSDPTVTSTNNEYYTVPIVPPTYDTNGNLIINPPTASAVWTFTIQSNGVYSFFVNIPLAPDSGQTRIVDADYTVKKTNSSGTTQLYQGRTSQTEANTPQYIAGPFIFQAGDVVSLTLDNTTAMPGLPGPTAANPGVIVADSATIQISSGHDVRGGAVVINKSDYPEIENASYYGLMPGTPNGLTTVPNVQYADPVPYGDAYSNPQTTTDGGTSTPDVSATSPALQGTGAAIPPRHDIRSLMYFGDSEVVTAVNRNVKTPYLYQHFVAAFYCVDALRGNVVWRYQCPDTETKPNGEYVDNGIFSTPVVTRINVHTDHNPANFASSLKQKLVVIFNDQSGKVYCLDALGNGILKNQSLYTGAVGTDPTNPDNSAYPCNQIIPIDPMSPAGDPIPESASAPSAPVTNFSMPLDDVAYDPTAGTRSPALNAWPLVAASVATPPAGMSTFTRTDNLTDGTTAHMPATATLNPTLWSLNTGQTQAVSLIAGTPVYWVFRPNGVGSTKSTQTFDYIVDDANKDSTNPLDIGPATLTGSWTPITDAAAYQGEYSEATTVQGAGTATADYKFQLPVGAASGKYTIQVTVPAPASGDTSTRINDAQYTVQVNGVTQYTQSVDQTTAGPFTFPTQLNITDVTKPIDIILSNVESSTDPAGAVVVADRVDLITTVTNDSTSTMPVPAAFNNASPAIYVEPGNYQIDTQQTSQGPNDPDPPAGGTQQGNPAAPIPPHNPQNDASNTLTVGTAYLYVTNSNGTIYSIDPSGVQAYTSGFPNPTSNTNEYASVDIDPTVSDPTDWTPSVNVKWWFSTRMGDPNSLSEIDSAPSILVPDPVNHPAAHRIFFATAKEVDNDPNQSDGRVYAIDSTGPVNPSGKTLSIVSPQDEYQWNYDARPIWSYPDRYGPVSTSNTGTSTYTVYGSGAVANPLGDITGTPVPFFNPDTGETRIYFAANSGFEITMGQGNVPTGTRKGPQTTGRIWSVGDYDEGELTGDTSLNTHRQSAWAYPSTWDANDMSKQTIIDGATTGSVPSSSYTVDSTGTVLLYPRPAMGAFLHATPAIGLVQFPKEIMEYENGVQQEWYHPDVYHNSSQTNPDQINPVALPAASLIDVKNQTVPMLYVGCDGEFDQGFYALDLDGGDTGQPGTVAGADDNTDGGLNTNGNNVDDVSRTIYRMETPNGFSWTSSPVLVANAAAWHNHKWVDSAGWYQTETDDQGNVTDLWGGGGSIFITGGNTLYQIEATPETNQKSFENGPFISEDAAFQGFGPLSPPTVGAANVSGLENTSAISDSSNNSTDTKSPIHNLADARAIYADPNQVTEWVYCGDQSNGIMRGITPQSQAFGVGSELSAEMANDPIPPNPVNLRLALHAYVGSVAKNSADMTTDTFANGGGPGGMLSMGTNDQTTFFDWGSSVYVRVTNVVPPNPGDTDKTRRMADPTGKLPANEYLTNGSPVSYTITEVPATQANSGTTFTDYQASGSVQTLTALPGDGFMIRNTGAGDAIGYVGSDDYNPANPTADAALQTQTLVDNVNQSVTEPIDGNEWLYASTYFIGNGTGHPDTPGAVRRIINATQTCQVYKQDNWQTSDSPGTPTSNTVTLTTELNQGVAYQNTNSSGYATGTGQTTPSPDPTFGIANPLSIVGAGIGVAANSSQLFNLGGGLGYILNASGDVPTKSAYPNTADTYSGLDMQANGNFVYNGTATSNDLPTAGLYINYDPSQPPGSNSQTANQIAPAGSTPEIDTDLGFVRDGLSGTNGIPANEPNDGTNTPKSLSNYGLNIGDRSQVGLRGMSIRVNMRDVPMQWFDSTNAQGPGAVVNPLPWEDVGLLHSYPGTNGSLDYPDIPTSNMQAILNPVSSVLGSPPRQGRRGDLFTGSATLDPRDVTVGTNPSDINNQNTYSDPVAMSLNVPKYQPANVTSEMLSGYGLPDGYTAIQRIFVDTNNNGQWDEGEAYRDFQIKTGVPINAGIEMGEKTVNIGSVVTGGFGVQMEPYMTSLDPLITAGNATAAASAQLLTNTPDVFSPYTAYFQRYFQPITVYNDGNINLLNIHMDQKRSTDNPAESPLMIGADAVDANAYIPGIDYLGLSLPTGIMLPNSMTPAGATSGGTLEEPFLLRSSLDTDLVQAYGRNPDLFVNTDPTTGSPWSVTYQGATFHKARAGSTSPSELTVPDYNPAVTDTRDKWYTAPPNNSLPSLSTSVLGTFEPTTPTVPYVSVEVPIGTAAGSYSQPFSVYDGSDAQYPFNAFGSPTGTYYSFYPQYGGQNIGEQSAAPGVYGTNDTFTPGNPYTTPSADIQVTVGESRLTDAGPDYIDTDNHANGTVVGALKQIPDPTTAGTGTSAIATTLPDFYPAAVRDLWWNGGTVQGSTGDLALLWSSARLAGTAGPAYNQTFPPLNLTGAFLANDKFGRFQAHTDNTTASNNYWWTPSYPFGVSGTPFSNLPAGAAYSVLQNGVNFGTGIAQDQPMYNPTADAFSSDGSDYAFWVNTDTEQTNPSSSGTGLSSIWCAKLDPTTATLGTPQEVTPALPTVSSGGTSANQQPITAALRGITGVRGLKYNANNVALEDPNTGAAIDNDLWAFWTVGGRGQSTIYYESGTSGAQPSFTGTPLALPVPAGLSSISDPSAVILPAPDTTAAPSGSQVGANPPATPVSGASTLIPPTEQSTTVLVPPTVPLIEVTYSGTNQSGSSDVYVSRYRPYLPSTSAGSSSPQDVALWPVPYPITNEQLQADPADVWWSARDVGWVRNSTLLIAGSVNGDSTVAGSSIALIGGGSSAKGVYDKASGLMVYTNLPTNNLGVNGQAVTAVYVDLPHGRIRFSPAIAQTFTLSDGTKEPININAWVNPMARRITASTQPGQNSEPISFVDEAFEPNEAASAGVTSPRVQAARRWFIYRKSTSTPSDVVNATLWMNTQRLGVPLYNSTETGIAGTDLNGKSTTFGPGAALTIDPSQVSGVTVTDQTTGVTLFPSAPNSSSVDIDWVHGYVYFPLLVAGSNTGGGWVSPEGHTVQITFTPHGASQTTTLTDVVRWVDESQFNNSANGGGNGSSAAVLNATNYWSANASVSSNERAVPIQTAISESTPWAFLDPVADADVFAGALDPFGIYNNAGITSNIPDQPHRIWLFWSSTRNANAPAGTNKSGSTASDLYYEALAPAFGATP